MNAKQRLMAISEGKSIDRIPFLPTILEHSANIIGKTPSEVALDAKLMAQSHIQAFKVYHHDAVTVGIDVYNIEAEALGCKVKYFDNNAIPGIDNHPYSEVNIDKIIFSKTKGRIFNILNAANVVNQEIGNEVNVSIGISGPFSIAVELVGYNEMIMACYMGSPWIKILLRKTLKHQIEYCNEILALGIGITIFESWATPPLISPNMYKEYVAPYEKILISHIKNQKISAVPLVIGGNTKEILDDILETGTTLLVADFGTDIDLYLKKAKAKNIILRANLDPKLLEKGSMEEIITSLDEIISKTMGHKKVVIGTGVVAYDTQSENIHRVRKYLEQLICTNARII